MKQPYPAVEAYAEGMLEVGDGQRLHWQLSGNPHGTAVVLLHGGPGSGSSVRARGFFDPQHYRIVQFDQRGCGKSLPSAADPAADFSSNTTPHLIADMERLRLFLGIERWLVFGHSWGSTLGLAYAERYPHRVVALVLAGVTMTRASEIEWLYRGMAPLFPEEWAQFRQGVPADARDGDLVEAYHRILHGPDPRAAQRAAKFWHAWEAAPILATGDGALPRRWSDDRYLLARARIVTHYFHHRAWLEEGQLLRDARRLAAIPGAMIHGRLDLEAPLVTAWDLARAWPQARLTVVPNAGHSPTAPTMTAAIVEATDALRCL